VCGELTGGSRIDVHEDGDVEVSKNYPAVWPQIGTGMGSSGARCRRLGSCSRPAPVAVWKSVAERSNRSIPAAGRQVR
jgi:hypothetical protein